MKAIYCHLDLETTGTNPDKDQVWSYAYALDTLDTDESNPLISIDEEVGYVKHNVPPTPWVLANTNYKSVFEGHPSMNPVRLSSQREFIQGFMTILASVHGDVTLVGAQPQFDAAFIYRLRDKYFPGEPVFHHRLVDVSTLVMGFESRLLGVPEICVPKSLKETYHILFDKEEKLGWYEHNAQNDMNMSRAIFYRVLKLDCWA